MSTTTHIALDWQSWVACGLGLLAVLHLGKRWWPKRRSTQALMPGDDDTMACAAQAPGACGGGGGGCGGCGSPETPIRVHRYTSRDTLGRTPGP